MRVFGVPLVPAVMGLILGPAAEHQLRRALAISQGDVTVLADSTDLCRAAAFERGHPGGTATVACQLVSP